MQLLLQIIPFINIVNQSLSSVVVVRLSVTLKTYIQCEMCMRYTAFYGAADVICKVSINVLKVRALQANR